MASLVSDDTPTTCKKIYIYNSMKICWADLEPLWEWRKVDKIRSISSKSSFHSELFTELLDQLPLKGPDLLHGELVPRIGEGGPEPVQVVGGDIYHVLDILTLFEGSGDWRIHPDILGLDPGHSHFHWLVILTYQGVLTIVILTQSRPSTNISTVLSPTINNNFPLKTLHLPLYAIKHLILPCLLNGKEIVSARAQIIFLFVLQHLQLQIV